MKKLTAKQRSEIYLKVAERVFSDCDDDVFLCCFLTDEYKIITRIKEYPVEYVFNLFDEFSLFSPENEIYSRSKLSNVHLILSLAASNTLVVK